MKTTINIILICFLYLSIFHNSYAYAKEFIVFVHGFAGFGIDELGGIGYWGYHGHNPKQNIVTWMQKQTGLPAYEASVGPFSSNWDRACELYAQMKARLTDYGKAHSKLKSHARFGRNFTKIAGSKNYYRQGRVPLWNESNKVHFIGHSMGGNTIRMLERLLHRGDHNEVALMRNGGYDNDPEGGMSDLFLTGHDRDWIASVTTISTPFDGSTLFTKLKSINERIPEYIKQLLFLLASSASASRNHLKIFDQQNDEPYLYDFDLDQHMSFPKPSKARTYNQFLKWAVQIFSSPVWESGYDDLCDYDLSPYGSKMFNAGGPRVFPNTRYFAMSTFQTKPCLLDKHHQCPDYDMNRMVLGLTASLMGDLDDAFHHNYIVDEHGNKFGDSWEQNDGVVSRISSTGPKFGVDKEGRNSRGAPIKHPRHWLFDYPIYSKSELSKAQWYYFDVERDHLQVIGFSIIYTPWFMYEHIRNILNAIKEDHHHHTEVLDNQELIVSETA